MLVLLLIEVALVLIIGLLGMCITISSSSLVANNDAFRSQRFVDDTRQQTSELRYIFKCTLLLPSGEIRYNDWISEVLNIAW